MIYFIACREADAVKIGVVSQKHYEHRPEQSAFQRLASMQSGCPLELELLGLCDGYVAEEAELHRRFAADRIRGEWFRLTPVLEAHIAQFPKPERPPRGWHSQSRNITTITNTPTVPCSERRQDAGARPICSRVRTFTRGD